MTYIKLNFAAKIFANLGKIFFVIFSLKLDKKLQSPQNSRKCYFSLSIPLFKNTLEK